MEWRSIPDYPGYRVSEYGDVCNRFDKWLRPYVGGAGGYFAVDLCRDGIPRMKLVNRLVCELWHGSPFPGAQAAHGDGSRFNNHYTNLRWATALENANDKRLHGTIPSGETHPFAKVTWDIVRQIRARHTGQRGDIKRIAGEFGLASCHVAGIVSRRIWREDERAIAELAA